MLVAELARLSLDSLCFSHSRQKGVFITPENEIRTFSAPDDFLVPHFLPNSF